MIDPFAERAHACMERDCLKTWVTFCEAPDIRCPFCSSTMVVFHVVPAEPEEKAA